MRPSGTVAAGLVALAAVAGLAWAMPVPVVSPAHVEEHEGQGTIALQGQVQHITVDADVTRFELHGDGAWLPVRVAGVLAVADGSWIRAEGSAGRNGGVLTLYVPSPSAIDVEDSGSAAPVDLAALAGDPAAWTDRELRVQGTVASGQLGDGAGHRVRIDGKLQDGPQTLHAVLGYAPACLCYVLHPVPSWTP